MFLEHLEERKLLTTIPSLHSLPGAPVAIYLDFDGHTFANGNQLGAYDEDGDPHSFSDSEQQHIQEAWRHTAVYFAPFNVDVTTVEPTGTHAWAVISPDANSWCCTPGSPANWPQATVNAAHARTRQSAIAHELAHAFGLGHQSDYDLDGNRSNAYSAGHDPLHRPTMGQEYLEVVDKWFLGHSDSPIALQDDIEGIAAALAPVTGNRPFRPDDHAGTLFAATPLTRYPDGWSRQLVGDFDGDGDDDLASFRDGDGTWWVGTSGGSRFNTRQWADYTTNSGWTSQLVGDFNNDGRDDIANFHPSNGTCWVSLSNGSAFNTTRWADFSTNSGWTSQLVGDFNHDGRDDIANFHPSNGSWWVSLSTFWASRNGALSRYFNTVQWADFSINSGWLSHLVGDFNQDGRADVASFHPRDGGWRTAVSTGSRFSTGLWGQSILVQSATGVLEGLDDVDAFSFTTVGGRVVLEVNRDAPSAVDTKIEIYDSGGTLLFAQDSLSNDQQLSVNLSPGKHTLLVASHGDYGDVGAFRVTVRPLRSGWSSEDIGFVAYPGYAGSSASLQDGQFSVGGSGADIWGTADQFRYTYTQLAGDGSLVARVATQENTHGWAKAGVMIRETLDPGSKHASMLITPVNGGVMQYRSTTAGNSRTSTRVSSSGNVAAPYWVKLERSGNTLTGYRSADGVTWIEQGSTTISMEETIYAGLAVTSHNNRTVNDVVFTDVEITRTGSWPPSRRPTLLAAPNGLTLTRGNGSSVQLAWNDVSDESGYDIERSADGANWTSVAATSANVTSYLDADLFGARRYFYRVSTLDGSRRSAPSSMASIVNRPSPPFDLTVTSQATNTLVLNWRDISGDTGYLVERSLDGVNFEWIASVDRNVTSYYDADHATLPSTVTSYRDTGPLSPATIYHYRVTALSPQGNSLPSPAASNSTRVSDVLPAPWNNRDIGAVREGGWTTGDASSGTFHVNGSGSDIWGTADSFHYVYQSMTGDGEIIAQVTDVERTHKWAKAGIMFRETLLPSSTYAFMFSTPYPWVGTALHQRTTIGGGSTGTATDDHGWQSGDNPGFAVSWLKLVRAGSSFTGYHSVDGVTWTEAGSTTISMGSTVYVGLAVTAHFSLNMNTSVFSDVAVVSHGRIQAIATGDVDGNGVPEVYTAIERADGAALIYRNDRPDSSTGLGQLIYGPNPVWTVMALTTGDVDGDGKDELYTAFERSDGAAAIYRSDSLHSATQARIYGPNLNWTVMALTTGVLDGDQQDELYTAFERSDGAAAIYRSDVPSSATQHRIYDPNHSWTVTAMAAGNVNGDDRDELYTAFERSDGFAAIYRSDSKWGAAANRIYNPTPIWNVTAIALGDVDNDGADKMFTAFERNDGHGAIYRSDSTASATQSRVYGPSAYFSVTAIALGDADDDGSDELFSGFQRRSDWRGLLYRSDSGWSTTNQRLL